MENEGRTDEGRMVNELTNGYRMMKRRVYVAGVAVLTAMMGAGCADQLESETRNVPDGGRVVTFDVMRPEQQGPKSRAEWEYTEEDRGLDADGGVKKLAFKWNTAVGTEATGIIHFDASAGSFVGDAGNIGKMLRGGFAVAENNTATASVTLGSGAWDASNDYLMAVYPFKDDLTFATGTDGNAAAVGLTMPEGFEQNGRNTAGLSFYMYMYGFTSGQTGDVAGNTVERTAGDLELKHATSILRFVVKNMATTPGRKITSVKMAAVNATSVAVSIFPSKRTITFEKPAADATVSVGLADVDAKANAVSVGLVADNPTDGSAAWNTLDAATAGTPNTEATDGAGRLAAYALIFPTGDLSDVNLVFTVEEELVAAGDNPDTPAVKTVYSYTLAGSAIQTKMAEDGTVTVSDSDITGAKPVFAAGYYYNFNLELSQTTLAVSLSTPTTKPGWGTEETPVGNEKNQLVYVGGTGTSTTEGNMTTIDPLRYNVYGAKGLMKLMEFINDATADGTAVDAPNTGTTTISVATQALRLATHITLKADIDLTGETETGGSKWIPIGWIKNSASAYTGTFDGGGHTIKGMKITTISGQNFGLIGMLGAAGVVKNVTLDGVNVVGTGEAYNIGAVAGINRGTINNCHVTGGSISAGEYDDNSYAGGIAGDNNNGGTIVACSNTATVTGTGNYVGGIAGSSSNGGRIVACSNTGSVSSTANQVGGIVGYNDTAKLYGCWNTGKVTGRSSVGSVVGVNISGTLPGCWPAPGIGDGTGSTGAKTVAAITTGFGDLNTALNTTGNTGINTAITTYNSLPWVADNTTTYPARQCLFHFVAADNTATATAPPTLAPGAPTP